MQFYNGYIPAATKIQNVFNLVQNLNSNFVNLSATKVHPISYIEENRIANYAPHDKWFEKASIIQSLNNAIRIKHFPTSSTFRDQVCLKFLVLVMFNAAAHFKISFHFIAEHQLQEVLPKSKNVLCNLCVLSHGITSEMSLTYRLSNSDWHPSCWSGSSKYEIRWK
jgi:hypothetical protein